MTKQVRFSLRAKQEEIELLEYIQNRFGNSKAKEVYERIEGIILKIVISPEMYPSSKKKEHLRKAVLSKQTSMYYRINENVIEIVSFRANRKNSEKFRI